MRGVVTFENSDEKTREGSSLAFLSRCRLYLWCNSQARVRTTAIPKDPEKKPPTPQEHPRALRIFDPEMPVEAIQRATDPQKKHNFSSHFDSSHFDEVIKSSGSQGV